MGNSPKTQTRQIAVTALGTRLVMKSLVFQRSTFEIVRQAVELIDLVETSAIYFHNVCVQRAVLLKQIEPSLEQEAV